MVRGKTLTGFRADRRSEYFAPLITFPGSQIWCAELGTFQTGEALFLLYRTMIIYPPAFSLYLFIWLLKFVHGKIISFFRHVMHSLCITVEWEHRSFVKPHVWINPEYPQQHPASPGDTRLQRTPFKTPLNGQTHKRHHCAELAISHQHFRVNWLIWCF